MKIFRRARIDFLTSGKTKKYLKYAIGEILLVVIGIIIALQINNWNEEAKENRVLNEYLVKIKSHTYEDLIEIDTMITLRRQLSNLCKKARKAMLTNKENENLYVLMASGMAFTDFYFKPKTDGYESLKNSSLFGKINNTALDSLLIHYHDIIGEIAENEKSYNEYMLTQEAHISTEFDRSLILASAFMDKDSMAALNIPQSKYMEDFRSYISSPAYRNVISLAAFQFDFMITQYQQLEKTGEMVIKEIDLLTR